MCEQFGAGIHALGHGTMAVHNCTFENHIAERGSALYNEAGTVEMHNCVFRNNTATTVRLQHASHRGMPPQQALTELHPWLSPYMVVCAGRRCDPKPSTDDSPLVPLREQPGRSGKC